MSVNSLTNKVIYVGDGVSTTFPFSFKVYLASDLVVQTLLIATGAVTTLTLGVNYTVSLTGAAPSTGNVILGVALPITKKLIITRTLPLTQLIVLSDNEGTPAATFEEGYDRLTMIAQQLQEQLARAIIQDPTQSVSLIFPGPSSGKLIGWNSDATGLTNYDPAVLGGGGGGGGGGGSGLPTPGGGDAQKIVRVDDAGSAYVISTLTSVLDLIFGSTRGMLLTRGVSNWGALSLGSANKVLASNGTDAVYQTLTTLLDAVFSSTEGALLYRGAATWTPLAIGTANKVLKTDGTDPSWATLTALLDAVFSSAQGAILYRDGSAWAALAPGTSGYLLKTQGAGANPVWVAAPGGSKALLTANAFQSATSVTDTYFVDGLYSTTETDISIALPFAGTLKNMYATCKDHDAVDFTITLMLNGSATALTLTLHDPGGNPWSDTTHSVAIAAADRISIKAHSTAGAKNLTQVRIVMEFDPS